MKNRDFLETLHETTPADLLEQEENPEDFLNEEAWPAVKEFLADLGMDLEQNYSIRLTESITGEGKDDFAGSAGRLADQVNDEKAIRLNPETEWPILALTVHEGVHKYQDELKDKAREIASEFEVFHGLTGFAHYLDIGNGIDYQYASLAHQGPERLKTIGRLGDQEVEKWRKKKEEAPENSEKYEKASEKEDQAQNLVRRALEREMELGDIDQESYNTSNYDEGFTMAAMIFALSGLEEESWKEYLNSDHEYAEEPISDITENIYERAKESEGDNMERMRKGMELQDMNYKEGEKVA